MRKMLAMPFADIKTNDETNIAAEMVVKNIEGSDMKDALMILINHLLVWPLAVTIIQKKEID